MTRSRIAILATGDELIEGKTLNSNAKAIAEYLFSEGLTMGLQMICSDKEADIIACMTHLLLTHETLIITGGLGPTSDDRTRFAVSTYLQLPLVLHEVALDHILHLSRRPHLTEGDKQQALFPAQARLFHNAYGTALGALITVQHKQIILLPGPPRECLPMFEQEALPLLKQATHQHITRLSWLVFGVREEYVGRILDEALKMFTHCETGYRLDTPYVECKIRCLAQDATSIQTLVERLFKPYFLVSSQEKASDMLRAHLAAHCRSIRIEDRATGGILQSLISTPETFRYLHFQSDTGELADFECDGLDTYWHQRDNANNEVYFKSNLVQAPAASQVAFPFKSKLVINMAAEWLCAQCLACLNRIHEG